MCLFTIWLQPRGLTWVWREVIPLLFLHLSVPLTCLLPLCGPGNNYHHGIWSGLGLVHVVKENIIKSWDLVTLVLVGAA